MIGGVFLLETVKMVTQDLKEEKLCELCSDEYCRHTDCKELSD